MQCLKYGSGGMGEIYSANIMFIGEIIDIANLATAGVRRIDAIKRPRVAFIPTGKELVPAGERPSRGQIIDCNSTMARAFGHIWC
jgi:molybdopterin biosynthesis enzyme